jgi:hypothetical protein
MQILSYGITDYPELTYYTTSIFPLLFVASYMTTQGNIGGTERGRSAWAYIMITDDIDAEQRSFPEDDSIEYGQEGERVRRSYHQDLEDLHSRGTLGPIGL